MRHHTRCRPGHEYDQVVGRPSRSVLGFFIGLTAIVAACGPLVNDQSAAPIKASYTLAPPTPTLSPQGTAGPDGPGQPYAAGDIQPFLERAPIGFPDELRTPFVAAAVADRVWSYDGRPYRDVLFGGSCESEICEFSVTGLPTFAPTHDASDTWFLRLDRRTGLISTHGAPSLKGFPPELVPELDSLARSLDVDGRLTDLALLGAQWSIPPPGDAFQLRYGKGLEEGDPTLLVTLSRSERVLLSIESS